MNGGEMEAAQALHLEVVAGQGTGETLAVEDQLVIGRHADEVGRLHDDPELSRRHAEIVRDASGQYVIEDLSSMNGTFVNDVRLDAPRVLSAGDIITVGTTRLLVTGVPAAPAETTSPVDVRAETVIAGALQPEPGVSTLGEREPLTPGSPELEPLAPASPEPERFVSEAQPEPFEADAFEVEPLATPEAESFEAAEAEPSQATEAFEVEPLVPEPSDLAPFEPDAQPEPSAAEAQHEPFEPEAAEAQREPFKPETSEAVPPSEAEPLEAVPEPEPEPSEAEPLEAVPEPELSAPELAPAGSQSKSSAAELEPGLRKPESPSAEPFVLELRLVLNIERREVEIALKASGDAVRVDLDDGRWLMRRDDG